METELETDLEGLLQEQQPGLWKWVLSIPAGVLLKASVSVFADCTSCSALQASESAEVWRLKMIKLSLFGYRECCKLFNLG